MDYNAILDQVGYPPEYNREKAIDAMAKITSIDKEIVEDLQVSYEYVAKAYHEVSELLRDARQRIAELEAELLRCKDQAEVYGNATVNAMDSADELQKRIAELEQEVKRLNDMVDNMNIEQE